MDTYDSPAAERLARLAVELAPPEMDPLDRGQILDTLGWVLYREESFEEAAKWLNEAADPTRQAP